MGQTKLRDEQYEASQAAGAVPVGGIIMWAGLIANIPTPDWQLCNGTANSPGPDLRDKFVVGAYQDDAGVAKSNVLGALSQSGGGTGHSHPLTISDHTGLTHGLTIANHPDLTHAALASHPTFSIPGATHADLSVASRSAVGAAIAGKASFASGTNRSGMTSVPTNSASMAASTYTRPSHPTQSVAGMTHATIDSHLATDYGVHTVTAPPAHGTAGTVTHSFSETTTSHVPTFYALAFIQRMS